MNNVRIFSIGIDGNGLSLEANTEATFYIFLGEERGYAKVVPKYSIGSHGGIYKTKDDPMVHQIHSMVISEILPSKEGIPEDLIYHNDTLLFTDDRAERPW